MKQTVKQKLVSAFILMAVLIIAVASFSLHTLKRQNTGLVELLEEHQPILTHMTTIVSKALFHSLKIDQYVATGNRAHLRMVEQLRSDVKTHIAALLYHIEEQQYRKLITHIQETFTTYIALSDNLIITYENSPEDLVTIQGKQMRIAALLENDLLHKANALYQAKQHKTQRLIAINHQHYLYSIRIVLIASIALTVIALTIALLISKSITRPIQHLVTISQKVAKGDLSARAIVHSSDEVAILTKTFNTMTDQLQELIENLEQRVAERTQELLEEKNFITTILDTTDALVVVLDHEGRIIRFNKACERATSYSFQEVAQRYIWDFLLLPEEIKPVKSVFQKLQSGHFPNRHENYWIAKSGDRRLIAWSNSSILDQNRQVEYLIGIGIDITEQKKAEIEKKKLLEITARAKKMEALGLLAAGVAHDLNNILSGIVSYPELLLLDQNLNGSMRKTLKTIKDSGERAAAVVSDLLNIARGVATIKMTVDLNDLINDFWRSPELTQLTSIYPFIRFDVSIEKNLLNIKASQIHIRKALINLMTNAVESISEHQAEGCVRLTAQNVYLNQLFKNYKTVNEGEYVLLSISDSGLGISPEDTDRIFEPFYTKKVMGRSGTGLGLTVVWNVVKDHNGYINVKSNSKGTCFELYFPATRDTLVKETMTLPKNDSPTKGECILVVDDVELQRKIACEMLTHLGYQPTSVASGEEAVEYLKENQVELILLDMIMDPGISGLETYKQIIAMQPGQKAIVVSGYSESQDVRQVQKLGAGQFIKKPYTLEVLATAVKTELER